MPFWVCSRLSAVKPGLYCARSRCAITDMAAEIKKEIELEIAHVLFTDIVGYSKLPIHQQRAVVERLNEIVRGTDEFQAAETAGRLIKIPTGDGITLVFHHSPEVICAVAIFLLVRLWARRSSGATRSHFLRSLPLQRRAGICGLAAAGAAWLEPSMILDTHGWPFLPAFSWVW